MRQTILKMLKFLESKKELEIEKKSTAKINRNYNIEIIEKNFSELYKIPKDYIIAYLDWSTKYGLNIKYSDEINKILNDKDDFEYYAIMKNYFEIDFKMFLEFIKDKYKPGTSCLVKKEGYEKIFDTYGGSRVEYIKIPCLTIKYITEQGYTIKTETGRNDYFYSDWLIGDKKDNVYSQLSEKFNDISFNNSHRFRARKEKIKFKLIEEQNKTQDYKKLIYKKIIDFIINIENENKLDEEIKKRKDILHYTTIDGLDEAIVKFELQNLEEFKNNN